MIAARAIGADETLIYVRTEYPLAVARMKRAVEDAEKMGFLGDNVFGSGQSLNCEVMEGAGAFVCGEETAMIASIEGQRGMPRPKPPFPAQSGLWGKPTIINNVETLAHVVRIINEGADTFRKLGTAASPGTKTFALTGHVANTGLIEVPFGTTLREVVLNIGGGITDRRGKVKPDGFKAVQIGGPSGGCLTQEHLDLPLDYDSLRSVGAMVGSGGLVAMNEKTCMVSIARFFMDFTQRESCGKCVLCREGTRQMLALLDDIIEGRATGETLELLEKLALGRAERLALRPGQDRAESGALDAALFPRGIRRARFSQALSDRPVQGAGQAEHRPGEMQRLHRLRQEMSRRRHQRREETSRTSLTRRKCIMCGVCADTCKLEAVVGV